MPLIIQAAPDLPVLRGVRDQGRDVVCPRCGNDLLKDVSANAIFDLAIQCARCAGVLRLSPRPPGRGLGGVLRVVKGDHRAVGTFVMDMDEVIVSEQAVRSRARETGADLPEGEPVVMGVSGIEQVIEDARAIFAPILTVVSPARGQESSSKHRVVRSIERLEQNLRLLRAGETRSTSARS